MSVADVDGLLEVAGELVDVVKLGWGTALVTANLRPKLDALRRRGHPGRARGDADRARDPPGPGGGADRLAAASSACDTSRSSDGTISLEADVKRELIQRLAREFTVLAEVGSKDADFIMAPYVWVEQIERDLQAGAWKVIAEARESGTAGIYRADR